MLERSSRFSTMANIQFLNFSIPTVTDKFTNLKKETTIKMTSNLSKQSVQYLIKEIHQTILIKVPTVIEVVLCIKMVIFFRIKRDRMITLIDKKEQKMKMNLCKNGKDNTVISY